MRTSRLRRLREEEGQAVVLTYVCVVVLLGMSALVLDVGAWYHAQRQLQASVDAAALAGAQAMPDDPGAAVTLANQYLDKNGGAAARSVGLKSVESANDSVSVSATRHAPGFSSQGPRHRERHGERRADRHGWGEPERGDGGRTDRRRREAPDAAVQAAPVLQRGDDARPSRRRGQEHSGWSTSTAPTAARVRRSCRAGHGIQGQTGGSSIDFGVRSVSLSE